MANSRRLALPATDTAVCIALRAISDGERLPANPLPLCGAGTSRPENTAVLAWLRRKLVHKKRRGGIAATPPIYS